MERLEDLDGRIAKVWAKDLEDEAKEQIFKMMGLPFLAGPLAIMADAHAGKGSTVGTVVPTKGAIIPAAVGVDIGCGMMALQLPFKIDVFKDLPTLRHSIERGVPLGQSSHSKISDRVAKRYAELSESRTISAPISIEKAVYQVGTLGGGNHFIEICGDENDAAWIMLHSGSRNLGKRVADYHISRAKGLMLKYFISLPDPDLAYLAQGTKEFDEYINDLYFAQDYAKDNREEMMAVVLEQVFRHIYGTEWHTEVTKVNYVVINCHHNYTSQEHHHGKNIYVTRKGAVSARAGEFGIIPGSMGTKSFIVQGLGHADSYHSCSHGAGRKMSRTKARASFTEEDLARATAGVECRKDKEVIDEIPQAYKDIDEVISAQSDLVTVVHTLKQILCVKG